MSLSPVKQTYRERITAIYAKYCPEKPLSHVDFLLTKYQGYEEDIIGTLVEKYGPEPAPPVKDYLGRVSAILGAKQGVSPEQASASNSKHLQTASQLLATHQGMEEHLIYSLMSRFGSEPQTRFDSSMNNPNNTINSSGSAEASFMPTAAVNTTSNAFATSRLQQTLDDPETALRERQERFQNDLQMIQQEQLKRQTVKMNTSAVELSALCRRQEVEIHQLMEALQENDAKHAKAELQENAQIERFSAQLTELRLRRLRCESRADPTKVSIRVYEAKSNELKKAKERLEDINLRTRALEEVIAKHLALYPTTPVRQALRRADPTLAARLDSL